MRVQLISKSIETNTGLGRYAYELTRRLPAIGVDVRQATLRLSLPPALRGLTSRLGVDLERFAQSYPPRADVRAGYLTHLTSQNLAMLLHTQRLPRPVVVTVHDILPYLLRDDEELSVYQHRLHRLADSLAIRGLRRADRLIADSNYTKQTIVGALGVNPDRIDVVHLGVDSAQFAPRPAPPTFSERYGLQKDRRYVLYVGSEDPRKDVPTLLRALAIARRTLPELELLKVGAAAFANERQRHLHLCDELGIADAVRWVDTVPEQDLPHFYNAADVFAFASRYEGFGFPVLEALACGTPVVAVDASSVPELTGGVATLVAPSSPEAFAAALVATLTGDRPPAVDLVQQATTFTWDRTIAATKSVYERATTGG